MMPFALAYCASELNCMDVDTAGQGLLEPSQFSVVKATSAKKLEEVKSKTNGNLERPFKTSLKTFEGRLSFFELF